MPFRDPNIDNRVNCTENHGKKRCIRNWPCIKCFQVSDGAKQYATKLKSKNIKIKTAVTDGESSLHKGFQEGLDHPVDHERDIVHVSKNQYRKATRAEKKKSAKLKKILDKQI